MLGTTRKLQGRVGEFNGESAITVPKKGRRLTFTEELLQRATIGPIVSQTQHILLYGINSFQVEIDLF